MICIKLPYFKCASARKKEAKGANYLDDDGRSLLDNHDNDARQAQTVFSFRENDSFFPFVF